MSDVIKIVMSNARGPTGAKGDPGGNVMSVGLLSQVPGLTVPAGTQLIAVSGQSAHGDGGAGMLLVQDARVDADYVIDHPTTSVRDVTGRGFRSVVSGPLHPANFNVRPENDPDLNVENFIALMAIAAATERSIEWTDFGSTFNADIRVALTSRGFVDIRGQGLRTGCVFSGTGVSNGFLYDDTAGATADAYDIANAPTDMRIDCTDGAKRAMTFRHVEGARPERVEVWGAQGAAMYFFNCINFGPTDCKAVGCGSATECAVVVTGTDAVDSGSTTYAADRMYISGGLAGGATSKKGGMSIDRCVGVTLTKCPIESTSTPIRIGGEVSVNKPVTKVTIDQATNLENPGDGNAYMEFGLGWGGAPGLGVVGVEIGGVQGTGSGSTAVARAIRMKNTTNLRVRSIASFGTDDVAQFELIGANNYGIVIEANRSAYGDPRAWVRQNGSDRVDATPYMDWNADFAIATPLTVVAAGTTPNVAVAGQGGIYGVVALANGSATNVTNFTVPPGSYIPEGIRILIIGDGNSTLVGGSAGRNNFLLLGGPASLLIPAGEVREFRSNGVGLVQL